MPRATSLMNICFVVGDLPGSFATSAEGRIASDLAILFARSGHHVTLYYCGDAPLDSLSRLQDLYRLAGISAVHLTKSTQIQPEWLKRPSDIYEELREKDFDVIVFQTLFALGHSCVVAKQCGISFPATLLVSIADASTMWTLENSGSFPRDASYLALSYMEQCMVELSDAVVAPTTYALNWMRKEGWRLPAQTVNIPYFCEGGSELLKPEATHKIPEQKASRVSHFVVFGGLEDPRRSGMLQAALASAAVRSCDFTLTLVGRFDAMAIASIKNYFSTQWPELPSRIDIVTDLAADDLPSYLDGLLQTYCVVVLSPLLDQSLWAICQLLTHHLPFIAENCGGVSEFIHPQDLHRTLFAADAVGLSAKLKEVLDSESWQAPQPYNESSGTAQRWLSWVEMLAKRVAAERTRIVESVTNTEVSVIITHRDRPRYLEQCLQGLRAQSDSAFETIVVDDGSKTSEALEFLDTLPNAYGLSLRVIRCAVGHPGGARNEGVRQVNTPYIIFLDDDDIPTPDMIEVFRRAAYFSKGDVITCQMQLFTDGSDGELPATRHRLAFSGGPVALAALTNCFGGVTAIYKRTLFSEIGPFHEIAGVGHEDWELYLRIALAGRRIMSVPQALFSYRTSRRKGVRRLSELYPNMRLIASALQCKVPHDLAPLIDLLIGRCLNAPPLPTARVPSS